MIIATNGTTLLGRPLTQEVPPGLVTGPMCDTRPVFMPAIPTKTIGETKCIKPPVETTTAKHGHGHTGDHCCDGKNHLRGIAIHSPGTAGPNGTVGPDIVFDYRSPPVSGDNSNSIIGGYDYV